MKIEKVIGNIGTVHELKRLASAYVIDYLIQQGRFNLAMVPIV